MLWQRKKEKEIPYKESKEFLQRQQDIDYLLVLSKFVDPAQNIGDLQKEAIKESEKIIDRLKK